MGLGEVPVYFTSKRARWGSLTSLPKQTKYPNNKTNNTNSLNKTYFQMELSQFTIITLAIAKLVRKRAELAEGTWLGTIINENTYAVKVTLGNLEIWYIPTTMVGKMVTRRSSKRHYQDICFPYATTDHRHP